MKLFAQLFKRVRGTELSGDHRRIAIGVAWASLFLVVGKLAAGGAKEIALAYRFGASSLVDAYQLGFIIATWIPVTLASVLPMIFVPAISRLRTQSHEKCALFHREILGTSLLIGGLLCVCSVAVFVPIQSFPSLKSLSGISEFSTRFSVGFAVLPALILVGAVFGSRLTAQARHWSLLLDGIPAVSVFIGLIILPSSDAVALLILATVFGFAIQTLLLAVLAKSYDNQPITPRLSWQSDEWKHISKSYGVMIGGNLVMSLVVPLDQYTAASMGDSSIAILSYSTRILGLIFGIGAMTISRAVLPVLADAIARGEKDSAVRIARQWSFAMIACGTCVAMASWPLAPLIIRIVFEHGAFSATDTMAVTEVFRFGLLQIPFYFGGLIIVQLLASQSRYRWIAFVAIGNFIVKLLLNSYLAKIFGLGGITLATGCMYLFSCTCFIYATRTRKGCD